MELYIEPIRPTRNYITGQFLKGHEPFNKGKKWSDYLPQEKIDKMRKQILSLSGGGRKDIGGWNKKSVIAIKNCKFCGIFESCSDAGRKLQVQIRNVSHVANGKRKRCGGYEFYFESDFNKWNERITQ